MPGMGVCLLYQFVDQGTIGLINVIACFNVASGDVEDAPALDPLAKFEVVEKSDGIYIKGEESIIKANRRQINTKCSVQGQEKVVVVGG